MKTIKTILLCSILAGFFLQCSSSENRVDEPVVIPQPSAEKLNALFDESLNTEKLTVDFPAENTNFIYTSPKGTVVTINGSCLKLNGAPVTGNVKLEFVELFNRANMSASNKPTMGILPNGEQEALLSGGAFYIDVKKDGKSLTTTCPVKIETPAANTGGIVPGMIAFNGVINNNELTWEKATDWEIFTNNQKGTYLLTVPGFGWFNCDKFSAYPEPKTTITAYVPTGYANASKIYLISKNIPNSLGTISGKYPVGLDCYLIFVTENNGNYMWITKDLKLVANQTVTFDLKDAKTGSRTDYVGHVTLLK